MGSDYICSSFDYDSNNFLKPILHTTHKNADPDSFAGVLWGVDIFGGCSLVHNPSRIVRNLMEYMNFRENTCWNFKRVFAYDVSSPEKLPITQAEKLVVVDHHSRNSFRNAKLIWRPRASLSMNLYDISEGLNLSEKVLFTFAVALVTDTAILRTASSEELIYLSKFLKGRKLEDVFKVIFEGSVKMEDFLRDLSGIKMEKSICFGRFSNEDHFLFFCDTFMYALRCNIVAGEFDWGVWIYAEKKMIQPLFRVLKILEKDFKRSGGRLIGANLRTVVGRLTDLLQL